MIAARSGLLFFERRPNNVISIHTYLLTPWSRVLKKLTGLQLVKKFTAFYGTRRFITAFTSARPLSLSWVKSIQSISPQPTSCRSILILSSHLRLGLPSGNRYTLHVNIVNNVCTRFEKNSISWNTNIDSGNHISKIKLSRISKLRAGMYVTFWNYVTVMLFYMLRHVTWKCERRQELRRGKNWHFK